MTRSRSSGRDLVRRLVPVAALGLVVGMTLGPAAAAAVLAAPTNDPSDRGVFPVATSTGNSNPLHECQVLTHMQDVHAMQVVGSGFPDGSPYTDGAVSVTISEWDATAKSFDWASSLPLRGVWVKGGSGGEGNWYDYASFADQPPAVGADHDGSLHTKPNPNGPAGLSHVTFCYGATSVPATPDVRVTKSSDADGPVHAGDAITYTLIVENIGKATATGVVVTDTLPDGVTFAGAPEICQVASAMVTCALGDLEAGAQAALEISVTVDGQTCGELTDVAGVSADNEPADATANDTDSVTDVAECAETVGPDLAVQKTSDADGSVAKGGTIRYTITTANVGDRTAHGVTVIDTLPSGLRVINLLPTMGGGVCSVVGASGPHGKEYYSVYCTRDVLGAGRSAVLTIDVQVLDEAACGAITNDVVVSADDEPKAHVGQDNEASHTDPIACEPSIRLSKSGPALAHVGDEIAYTFTVTNDGALPLSGVALIDPRCDAAPAMKDDGNGDDTLSVGETWRYSCTHVVAAADGDPLRNTAAVHAWDRSEQEVTDTASHDVDVIHPAIRILKTVSPGSGSPGDPVTYAYEVTNTGDATLFGISIDDDVLGHIGDVAHLAAGASITMHADYQLPADRVEVTNVGTATGTDVLGRSVSDDDAAAVTVVEAGGGGNGNGSGNGGTAFTGSDSGRGMTVALLLGVMGAALLVLGRRRDGVR